MLILYPWKAKVLGGEEKPSWQSFRPREWNSYSFQDYCVISEAVVWWFHFQLAPLWFSEKGTSALFAMNFCEVTSISIISCYDDAKPVIGCFINRTWNKGNLIKSLSW